MSKAAKRQRKKEGRRQRIEAETKAAEARRRRNLNILLGVVLVVVVGFFAYTRLTRPAGKKVSTSGSPTATATPSQSPSPSPSPSPTSTAGAPPAAVAGCTTAKPPSGDHATQPTPPPMTISPSKTYTASVTTSCGTFTINLDAKDSPNTVNSFVYLANKGFFNGLTFHRISRGADVIQGGDPKGDGSGGPGYTVRDSVPAGVQYTQGTVAMAKTGADPDGTAGSQFFVVPSGTAQIGPNYGVLGNVTSGLDVVQKIFSIPIAGGASDGPPAQPVYIHSVTIVTS